MRSHPTSGIAALIAAAGYFLPAAIRRLRRKRRPVAHGCAGQRTARRAARAARTFVGIRRIITSATWTARFQRPATRRRCGAIGTNPAMGGRRHTLNTHFGPGWSD